MGKKRAAGSPSSSTSNASDSYEYVMVPSAGLMNSTYSSEPPSLQNINARADSIQLKRAKALLARFPSDPDDYYYYLENDVYALKGQDDLRYYLVKLEECIERHPALLWLLNVETRYLNAWQAKRSWMLAKRIIGDCKPFYEKLNLTSDEMPSHTYEVVQELYKLDLTDTFYEKIKLKGPGYPAPLPWAPFRSCGEFEPMDSYLLSARSWIRDFILPGNTYPGSIHFVAAHLLQGLENFADLRKAIEAALVKKLPKFQMQSDVFKWFRQFVVDYKTRGKLAEGPTVFIGSLQVSQPRPKAEQLVPLALTSINWQSGPPIPNSYDDAINGENKTLWEKAMDHHVSLLNSMNAWTAVEKAPKKAKKLQADWSFSSRNVAGSQLFYAELVVRDSASTPNLDLPRSSVQSVSYETVRLMLALAVQHDWRVERVEVDTAMSYGTVNRNVYVRMPTNVASSTPVVRLNRTMNGLKEAQLVWYNHFCDIVEDMGFEAVAGTPGLFYNKHQNVRTFMLLYVDDILIFSGTRNRMKHMKSQLRNSLHTIEHGFPESYLSLGITKLEDGSLRIDSQSSVAKVLDKYAHLFRGHYNFSKLVPVLTSEMIRAVRIETSDEDELYWGNEQQQLDAEPLSEDDLSWFRSIVGSLVSLVDKSRPDIAYITSYLSTYMNGRPNELHWRMLMRLLCYLDYHKDATLRYRKQGRTELVCYARGATNFTDISDTHCSAVWSYGDRGSKDDNKIHWQSWNISRQMDSHNAMLTATKTVLDHAAYLDDLLVLIDEKELGEGGVLYANTSDSPKLGKNRFVKKYLQERGMELCNLATDHNPAFQLCTTWSHDDFDGDNYVVEHYFE